MTHLFDTPAKLHRGDFGLKLFVETGCEHGEALVWAHGYGFKEEDLFSCDIRREAVNKVKHMFPKATIIRSDSLEFLRVVLPTLTEPALFWLDAHFPKLYGDASEAESWPMFEELQLISQLKRNLDKDVIICDDLRVIQNANNPRYLPGEVEPEWIVPVTNEQWDRMLHFFPSHYATLSTVDTGFICYTPKYV